MPGRHMDCVRFNLVVLNFFLYICHQMAFMGFQLHRIFAAINVGFALRHMI